MAAPGCHPAGVAPWKVWPGPQPRLPAACHAVSAPAAQPWQWRPVPSADCLSRPVSAQPGSLCILPDASLDLEGLVPDLNAKLCMAVAAGATFLMHFQQN